MPFNPYTQNLTLIAPTGNISIPLPAIDAYNTQTVNMSLSYASQLGACAIMLAVLVALTPLSKLRRPSTLLHLLGLAVNIVRMTLLSIFFVSPFGNFYRVWANDFRAIPSRYYLESNASTVSSLALLVITQAALMNQAWTMVSLLPRLGRWLVAALSLVVSLLTVAIKLALTVVQIQAVSTTMPAYKFLWLSKTSIVLVTLSTCWYCAVFNYKLAHHLVSNRGVLPSRAALNPMEVLIMANGILMIIPVLFVALQWVKIPVFEAGSFALTSIALILPLGTLAAQRVAQLPVSVDIASYNSDSVPSKSKSLTFATATDSANPSANHAYPRAGEDPVDVELRHIESGDGRIRL